MSIISPSNAIEDLSKIEDSGAILARHAVPAWSVADRTTLAVALNCRWVLRYGGFGSLFRARLHNLPNGLRLECRRLLCERVDALPRLCGRLLDDDEFGETRHKKTSRLLEFFLADFSER